MMKYKLICNHDETGELTTDHAASSYGIPVLLVRGEAYGPGDLLPATVICFTDTGLSPQKPLLASDQPEAKAWNQSVYAAFGIEG